MEKKLFQGKKKQTKRNYIKKRKKEDTLAKKKEKKEKEKKMKIKLIILHCVKERKNYLFDFYFF